MCTILVYLCTILGFRERKKDVIFAIFKLNMKKQLVLFLLFVLSLPLQSSNFYYQTVGRMQGLSQPSAVSIWQDGLGRMWFGNDALNCFDGERTHIYRMSEHLEGLEDGNIHAICGNDSIVYCLAEDQLIRLDLTTEKLSLPGICTQAICCAEGGLYYMNEGVLHFYHEAENRSSVVLPLASRPLSARSLLVVSPSRLLVGTAFGIYTIDLQKGSVVLEELQQENIHILHQDHRGDVWAASRSRTLYVSREGRPFARVEIQGTTGEHVSTGDMFCLENDIKDKLWIGTLNGAYQLDEVKGEPYTLRVREHIFLESTLFSLFSDRQGLLWVGPYYGDVRYFNPQVKDYEFYAVDEQVSFRLHGAVQGQIAEDKQGNIYIATEGSGMNILRPGEDRIEHLTVENGKIPHNKIRSLWFDPDYDRLYMGPYMEGLYYIDLVTGQTHKVKEDVMCSSHANIVEEIVPYKNHLILLTQEGLFKMDRKTLRVSGLFEQKELKDLCEGIILTIYIDKRDVLWISSYRKGLFTVDMKNERLLNFYGNGLAPESTIPSAVIDICGDTRHGLFFATLKSGVLNYQFDTDTFVCFSEKNAHLLSDICYNITFSSEGKLVVTSNNGISFLNLSPKKTVLSANHFQLVASFPLKGLSGDCGLYTSSNDGRIYVGGLYGLLVLPAQVKTLDDSRYPIYFSSLQINNEKVFAGAPLLPQSLPKTKELILPYDQNTLSLSFASSDYVNYSPVLYEYKLEGLDNIWTRTEHKTVTYTSLRPGKYKLIVREVQNPYRQVELICLIRPPFWKALPALIFYMLIGTWLLWKIFRFQKSKTILQATLEMERREAARIEEMNQNKLKFFTNISNEFRTPLTLISNQLDRLYIDLPPVGRNKADKIRKQAVRLQNLISELLDFRKMEQKQLRLKVRDYDLNKFLKDLCETYNEYALENKIHYKWVLSSEPLRIWFDKGQMQKVFYNLLSFVFKSAGTGDEIQLVCGWKNTCVEIQISSTGKIKDEKLWKEIGSMINSDSPDEWSSLPDSGIGLAFSRGIVRLHGGSIQVRQEDDTIRFTLYLLSGKSHFLENDFMESQEERPLVEPSAVSVISPASTPRLAASPASGSPDFEYVTTYPAVDDTMEKAISAKEAAPKYRMLLVANNDELRSLLKDTFMFLYQVETVENGSAGYTYAVKEQPDIILSEVNIPELSGIELCNRIKSNVHTLHIPVILITAHPSAEQETESIRSGASDYIVAPFHIEKLLLCCNSLVKNQKKIVFKYTKEIDAQKDEMATNAQDLEFLATANHILETHEDKADFDIAAWGKELGIGRTRLFNKIKAITGLTPNDYILQVKMKKSLILLTGEERLTIAEIAYRLGFSNPAYFSKCFKKQFGMTPQEYRKN